MPELQATGTGRPQAQGPQVGSVAFAISRDKTSVSVSEQADATMAASNRPMFCLSAMSATLRKVRVLLQGAVPMQCCAYVYVRMYVCYAHAVL